MNPGIVAQGYEPAQMPRALLGVPKPVPMPYGRAGDPYWAKTSCLIVPGGPPGSQTFADLTGKTTVVAQGATLPSVSTVKQVYTSSSMSLDGTTSQIEVRNGVESSGCAFGTGDFTVEAVFNLTAIKAGTNSTILSTCPSSGTSNAVWLLVLGADLSAVYYTGGAVRIQSAANAVKYGRWHHIAAARAGGVTRLFLDGTYIGQYSDATSYATPAGYQMQIGQLAVGPNHFFNGWMDSVRVTKGVSRYDKSLSFAPPTASFPIGFQ